MPADDLQPDRQAIRREAGRYRVAAGWPVMLMGNVNASHWNGGTMRPSIFSGPWMWSANGGTASVGVSSRS